MAEQYYVLRLWDYATPSFCSFDKIYVGTEAEISTAIMAMEKDDRNDETVKAVRRYLNGDRSATHNIAYQEIPALESCEYICSSKLTVGEKKWVHINTWGFPYLMKCDSALVSQVIVKYKKKYYRCVRAWFKNLCYESVSGKWDLLGTFFLGPGYLFDVTSIPNTPRTMNNLLYAVEEIYDSLKEADDTIRSVEHLNFKAFCDDIFGDG